MLRHMEAMRSTDHPARERRTDSPPTRPAHRPTGASLVAVVGVAVAFVGVMVMHAVRSDVDPLRDVMSHYANGSRRPGDERRLLRASASPRSRLGIRLRTAIDQHGVTRAFPVLLGAGRRWP